MLIYSVNVWGVVLAAVASMVIGMIWYGPLFGKQWMRLVEMKPEMMAAAKSSANKSYIFMTVSSLVMFYVLGLFIKNLFIPNLIQAIAVGCIIWVGFIATSMTGEYLFNAKPKPWSLYLLNSTYYLVNLIVGAAILFLFIK